MKKILLQTISVLALCLNFFAQTNTENQEKKSDKKEKVEVAKLERSVAEKTKSENKAIEERKLEGIKYRLLQGNGLLVTEAYISPSDELSHTVTFERSRNGDWESVVSETMPLRSERHQLTVSLPATKYRDENNLKIRGFGDVGVEYRFRMFGNDVSRVTISPGFAASLPTGAHQRGLGAGGLGVELSLPVSVSVAKHFMTHSNLRIGFTPNARNSEGVKSSIRDIGLGQSFVWLATPKINPVFEVLYNRNSKKLRLEPRQYSNELFISPGIRWAHTFGDGFRIVPGIAIPVGVGPSRGQYSIFLTLSFQHRFKKTEG